MKLKDKLKNALEKSKKNSQVTEPVKKIETKKLSKLQEKMNKKLSGSKFRWINESLYTSASKAAFTLFAKQPELFEIYHQGFQSQVEEWPVNPVDLFIEYLKGKPKETVVADMGCGVANIAKTLHSKMTIYSFDLIKGNEFITACDIAHVPLKLHSVDITIFALSLMGTNFIDFIKEAFRILKPGGELKIAEVVSRISDLSEFTKGVEALGFKLTKKVQNF
jgi:ribosomal RNA-processing protein 8